MLKQANNTLLIGILAFISLTLISALTIEYGLGHKPCKLCLYERIPYILSMLLITVALFIEKYKKITLLILFFVFVVSVTLAFYHFGIEQGFFNESLICETKNISDNLSKEQLIEQLKNNSISCKDVSFKIFALSLAAINTVFSFVLGVIFLKLFMNYGKN